MYTPTTLQTPSGHMTRPQRYAIGHKVNSLLSEPSLSTCEIWLLPPTCVLCMIRYLEESHESTTSNGTASEDAKYKDPEKKLREATATGRPAQPGRPAPEDPSRIPGRPKPPDRPDIRHHLSRAKTPDVRHAPDDRTLASHRTSGTCRTSNACAPARVLGRSHLPFHWPRLYILLHLLLVRVSVVIAHLRDRATLIHYGSTPRERPRPLYGEDPCWIQDLLTEKNRLPCIVHC